MDRKDQLRRAKRAYRVPFLVVAEILIPVVLFLIFRERLIVWPYAGPAVAGWAVVILITVFTGMRWREEI
ncbi:MAG: hypothetical protein KGM97_04015 [Alphaproteobacteria bacterium]|nr:hypothetical protein [Alphaproteobacteria bacterium]MDE2630138.1 hypothetical protein [Alphaproteobacteria bacterium]